MADQMTRRQFIVTAGTVVAGGVVLGATSGCSGPSSATDAEIRTPSSTYEGDADMSKRIMVGYATRTGSTIGVAEEIAKTLAKRGFAVDVKPLKERPSLDGYDAVLLGSAVNGGAWLPEAVKFVEAQKSGLSKIPVAVFSVHIMNMGDDEKSQAKRRAYINPVRALIHPTDEAYFAGVGPTAKDSSLIMRWAFRAFGGGGEGDCRDWDKIRSWTQTARLAEEVSS